MPANWPLWMDVAVFCAAAAVVWAAGTRIAGYADRIAEETGIGRDALGILLLGGVTLRIHAHLSLIAAQAPRGL